MPESTMTVSHMHAREYKPQRAVTWACRRAQAAGCCNMGMPESTSRRGLQHGHVGEHKLQRAATWACQVPLTLPPFCPWLFATPTAMPPHASPCLPKPPHAFPSLPMPPHTSPSLAMPPHGTPSLPGTQIKGLRVVKAGSCDYLHSCHPSVLLKRYAQYNFGSVKTTHPRKGIVPSKKVRSPQDKSSLTQGQGAEQTPIS